MRHDDALVAVGDRFQEFLANKGTIAVSRLLGLVRAGGADQAGRIVIGQGLSAAQLAELREHVDGAPAPADRELTHKHDRRNIMISVPVQVDERRYAVDLVLDQDNETIKDHLTGQHIPAIALLEAARQTWTAVTERFYPVGWPSTRFVIESVAGDFASPVLPLPATLEYILVAHETNHVQQRFQCLIEIRQCGTVAALVDARYRVLWGQLAAKREAVFARQLLAGNAAAEVALR